MTPRQKQVFDFVSARLTAGEVCPSYVEIAAAVGLRSISNIHRIVEALEAQGLLTRTANRERALSLGKPELPKAAIAIFAAYVRKCLDAGIDPADLQRTLWRADEKPARWQEEARP